MTLFAPDSMVIALDKPTWTKTSIQPPTNPKAPSQLAYLLCTSGSAGRPKGVAVSHQALLSLLDAMAQKPGLQVGETLVAITSPAFDISLLEWLLPLLVGARVLIADQRTQVDGLRLASLLHQADCMQATPATWQMLLDSGWKGQPGLKIWCGGEAMPASLAQALLVCGGELWNLYGPTETTIWSTAIQLSTAKMPIPIGRPITNTELLVLDHQGQSVPIGVPGELYIGGNGVAQGYWQQPKETATCFVTPIPQQPQRRFFRSGDQVRWREDGALDFLGRKDAQLKILGHRIEPGEIEAVLEQHSWVHKAVVVSEKVGTGSTSLFAYITTDSAAVDIASLAEWRNEQLRYWQAVWERCYSPPKDPLFNTIGWNSSYSGKPLPKQVMRAWQQETCSRILALKPTRVLEIGCGSGLILFEIAPCCQEYWATDFSERVLAQLRTTLDQQGLSQVRLLPRTADQLQDLDSATFDGVILNSVIQYFPDIDYLRQVLAEAVRLVVAGGWVFIGDIRSLALLRHFHASVVLYQANPTTSRVQLKNQIAKAMAQEEELLLDPSFFTHLGTDVPRIKQVSIQPKQGLADNELNRYRYDVVLHIEPKVPTPVVEWRSGLELKLDCLRQYLQKQPLELAFCTVPNARITTDLAILRWLDATNGLDTVGAWRANGQVPTTGVDPEAIWQLGAKYGYRVSLSWAASHANGAFDVRLQRGGDQHQVSFTPEPIKESTLWPKHRLSNYPLRNRLVERVLPELRTLANRYLPKYMVPTTFYWLETLPRLWNGKLDRKALLQKAIPLKKSAGTAPKTPVEKALASLWLVLLDPPKICLEDHFFELGGHSLLATRLIARISERFQIELTLQSLFNQPTLKEQAEAIEAAFIVKVRAMKEKELQQFEGEVPGQK